MCCLYVGDVFCFEFELRAGGCECLMTRRKCSSAKDGLNLECGIFCTADDGSLIEKPKEKNSHWDRNKVKICSMRDLLACWKIQLFYILAFWEVDFQRTNEPARHSIDVIRTELGLDREGELGY